MCDIDILLKTLTPQVQSLGENISIDLTEKCS